MIWFDRIGSYIYKMWYVNSHASQHLLHVHQQTRVTYKYWAWTKCPFSGLHQHELLCTTCHYHSMQSNQKKHYSILTALRLGLADKVKKECASKSRFHCSRLYTLFANVVQCCRYCTYNIYIYIYILYVCVDIASIAIFNF